MHFLEEAIFNTFVIYQKNDGEERFCEFKLNAIDNMLT